MNEHQKPPTGWLDIRVRTIDLLIDVMVESICATEDVARRVTNRLRKAPR